MQGFGAISELAVAAVPFPRGIANSNSGYQTGTPYSWFHTCSGQDRCLYVMVSMLSVIGSSVSSITYNGVALTLVRGRSSAAGAVRVEIWRLVNPDAGRFQITVTLSAALDSIGHAVSFTNVHQTTPNEADNDASATNVGAADATVGITPTTDNCYILDCVATTDTAIVVGSGQDQQSNVTGALGSGGSSVEGKVTPVAVTTMNWSSVGAAATWTIVGLAVRPNTAHDGGGHHRLINRAVRTFGG